MAMKYITEVLAEINKDPTLFQTTYKKSGTGSPLEKLFFHAFTSQGKFLLPEGEPPFRKSKEPIGMTPARVVNEIKKFYHFCRTDLKPAKRETMFIQLLECIHPDEAKIIIAVKDQTLTKLYPNITRKAVADAGFIPAITEDQIKQEEIVVKKSGRPRGRPRTSVSPQ